MYLYENLFIWKFISSPSAKRNILLTKRTKDESIKYAILFVLSFCSFCYLFVCIFCAMPSSEDNKTIPDADLKDNLSFYSFSSIKFCFIRIATRLSEKRRGGEKPANREFNNATRNCCKKLSNIECDISADTSYYMLLMMSGFFCLHSEF